MKLRMRVCARLVLTKVSQSFEAWLVADVRISTVSPF
jgi:hypothetical protein